MFDCMKAEEILGRRCLRVGLQVGGENMEPKPQGAMGEGFSTVSECLERLVQAKPAPPPYPETKPYSCSDLLYIHGGVGKSWHECLGLSKETNSSMSSGTKGTRAFLVKRK
jgi:hypothetical protein